jgi:glutamine---fructose-6-phosphate transaminase (isomerizing)
MCGIFGYSGTRNAAEAVMEGLKRLEYRGYDSWGIAFQAGDHIEIKKKVGPIGDLQDNPDQNLNTIAVGHTRWATHGGVTELNAHPHTSTDGRFVLAQNGIVENYQELKKELIEKGYPFYSQTDTEVIVRLVEEKLKTIDNLRDAVRAAFLDLHGRNTIIVLENGKKHIIAIRNGSPLVLGVDGSSTGQNASEYYFASDTLSFANYAKNVVFLNDMQMAELDGEKLEIRDVKDNSIINFEVKELDHDDVTVDKEGYDHFMLKEIVEQKHTIREAVQYSEDELQPLVDAIKSADRVYTVGAGTAGFAAAQIAFYLRKYGNVTAIELKSYEVGSYKNLFTEKDLVIAISQSGETADTIEALEYAKNRGSKIASVVNMVGSTITRMSDYQYHSRSGPEICVASTKAFTAQISWGYVLAKAVAGKYTEGKNVILSAADKLQNFFSEEIFSQIKQLVDLLKKDEHFFILGKGQNYCISLEGSLKVKEITYKHFEGFPAGELKHGVISLVEKGTPVFLIVSEDEDKNDMISAAAEVKARGAYTIGICKQRNELFDFSIETPDAGEADPIVNVLPFQLISYFLGVELGNSPDRPRNLAKSVTVK